MGRPRKPTALQEAAGRTGVNPGRYTFRQQNEPDVDSKIGDPPDYILNTDENKARDAWRMYSIEIPWLNTSHRSLIEAASLIRGEILAGKMPGIQRLSLLRGILQSLGATPSDSSKVGASGSPPPSGDGESKPKKSIFSDDDDDDD